MTVSVNRAANGTVTADRTPWAGLFPMNAVTPITAVHLGIEYRSEVVRGRPGGRSASARPQRTTPTSRSSCF